MRMKTLRRRMMTETSKSETDAVGIVVFDADAVFMAYRLVGT